MNKDIEKFKHALKGIMHMQKSMGVSGRLSDVLDEAYVLIEEEISRLEIKD